MNSFEISRGVFNVRIDSDSRKQWGGGLHVFAVHEDNVYGTLRRHEINITTCATYSFTRDLTLEAYLQPFVAVGNYFDIRKLARAKSFEFTPVTLADDPDFNKKSVRGTVVLRWEYVRGSTLSRCGTCQRRMKTRERGPSRRGATLAVPSAHLAPTPSRSN